MKFRVALGDVLKELRLDKGWTLRKLSTKADVSLGYLSEVERGQKELSSEVLASIANAIQVPLHQIIIEAGHRIQLSTVHTYESVEPELTAV
jgi:transcriptional regulator with XRE-family HTH domain